MGNGMRYKADITAGALKLPESRRIADLLLQGTDEAGWKEAMYDQNILQARNPATARRLTMLIRGRLGLMGADLWKLVRDGTSLVATHACLAAAVKHSPLLGDFLDLVVREQYRCYAEALSNKLWDDYLDGCRERDPEMPQWNESTIARLRSSVFQMLAQAGYIENTRSLKLQTVHIADSGARLPEGQPRRVRPALHPGGPMSDPLNERLNKILPRIISDDVPERQRHRQRDRLLHLRLPARRRTAGPGAHRVPARPHPEAKAGLRVKHVNLFDFVLDYLQERKLLDKAIQMQRDEGRRRREEGPCRRCSIRTSSPSLRRGRPAGAARSRDRVRCRQRLAAAASRTPC